MPRRAILSILLIFSGTLSGSAATLDLTARNVLFQPRSAPKKQVLKPAEAVVLGHERQARFKRQKITPIWQAPAAIKVGRATFKQPGDAVMPSVAVKAAGAN